MINYITYILLTIIILGDLIGIFAVLLGRYTSVFVRYFTVIPVDPNQLKRFSKNKQKKFNSLVAIGGMLNILIAVLAFSLIFSRGNVFVIVFISLFFSANYKFFDYRTRKLLGTNS